MTLVEHAVEQQNLFDEDHAITSMQRISVVPEIRAQLLARIEDIYQNIQRPLRPKVISLFSGCGGLDLGFRGDFPFLGINLPSLGYELVWANDNARGAVETYQHNLGRHVHLGAIENFDKSSLPAGDIVIGGFPCKDFSVSGSWAGITKEQGRLYLHMRDVIDKIQPVCFIAENVTNIITIHNGSDYEQIKRDFEQAGRGYKITHWQLDATHFGIAQTRRRAFIIGIRSDLNMPIEQVTPPNPLLLPRPLSAYEILEDLRTTGQHLPNQDQVSRAGLLDPSIRSQGDEAIRRDQPGPTIRATHHGRIQFHYEENRRITVREAARIQSFPDSFVFTGKMTNNYRQIGNAVPPVLAWHVAAQIREILEKLMLLLPAH